MKSSQLRLAKAEASIAKRLASQHLVHWEACLELASIEELREFIDLGSKRHSTPTDEISQNDALRYDQIRGLLIERYRILRRP